MRLDPEQLEVVSHRSGPALVTAGPGSGKTGTLAAWVKARLEEGFGAERICVVTFTQKAARELRRRIGDVPDLFVGTVHALALRILLARERVYPLPEEEEEAFFREQTGLPEEALKLWRTGKRKEAALKAGLPEEALEEKVREHERELLSQGLVPVPLLVREAARRLEEDERLLAWARERAAALLVDEFQDTDEEQFWLFTLLAPPPEATFIAVGDVNQSIYEWRGATPGVVEDFREVYSPKEYVLHRNYRAAEPLVRLASALAGTPLTPTRRGGKPPVVRDFPNPFAEAAWIAERAKALLKEGLEVGVLVRSRQQLAPLEEAFLRLGTPYSLAGGVAFESRREVKLFMALLRAATLDGTPLSTETVLRLTDMLPGLGAGFAREAVQAHRPGEKASELFSRLAERRGRGREGLKELAGLLSVLEAVWEEDLPLEELVAESLEAAAELMTRAFRRWKGPSPEERLWRLKRLPDLARAWRESRPSEVPSKFFPKAPFFGEEEGGAVLSTVHAAKGLEWDAVFVPGLAEGIFPALSTGNLEEERRLFYVAVTRAKELLFLTWPRASLTGKPLTKSRFLESAEKAISGLTARENASG